MSSSEETSSDSSFSSQEWAFTKLSYLRKLLEETHIPTRSAKHPITELQNQDKSSCNNQGNMAITFRPNNTSTPSSHSDVNCRSPIAAEEGKSETSNATSTSCDNSTNHLPVPSTMLDDVSADRSNPSSSSLAHDDTIIEPANCAVRNNWPALQSMCSNIDQNSAPNDMSPDFLPALLRKPSTSDGTEKYITEVRNPALYHKLPPLSRMPIASTSHCNPALDDPPIKRRRGLIPHSPRMPVPSSLQKELHTRRTDVAVAVGQNLLPRLRGLSNPTRRGNRSTAPVNRGVIRSARGRNNATMSKSEAQWLEDRGYTVMW